MGWDRVAVTLGTLLDLVDGLEWADDDDGPVLPRHRELVERFGVPGHVVTEALQEARRFGVIEGGQGRRTVARRRPLHRHGGRLTQALRDLNLGGFFSDAAGADVRVVVLAVGRAGCPPPAARRLGVPTGTDVLVRYRRYDVDSAPVQLAWSHVPLRFADRAPSLWREDTGRGGMYARLAEIGHAPVVAVEEIEARVPSRAEVRDLEITEREPVLVVWRTVFDGVGTPLEAVRIVMRASRVRLTYPVDMS